VKALALKYRPKSFDELIGQEVVANTLTHALDSNRLGHAYLFSGLRGSGKTSSARIFAKALLCQKGISAHPCEICPNCVMANENRHMDIIEMDAASHRKIDDIRELIEQTKYSPSSARFKVFIIDEVHMLTKEAFNALLKTLEEPPAYAKFILATTEKHKIPATIISRCQIFDFKRINTNDIAQHLEYIAQKENIAYEIEALHLIAQKADGGLRDALSMFDQLVSFTSAKLSYKNIIDNLNILDYEYYFKLVDNFLNGRLTESLLLFDEVLKQGFEASAFINGLAAHLRNLLVCKDPQSVNLLDASQNLQTRYLTQASQSPQNFILKALDYANSCALEYKESYNKRLCVELCLMKLAYITNKVKAPATQQVVTPQQPQVQVEEIKKKMTY
jgi:DNA polymerase-3 subunit gamma/tau